MNFGELMARTGLAQPDAPVRIRTADGKSHEIADVETPLVDLDEGKKIGDVAEGQSRNALIVWLVLDK